MSGTGPQRWISGDHKPRKISLGSRHGGLSLWMALYESIDATSIPYAERFDVILFKSMLGAVRTHGGKRSQIQAMKEIHRALVPGGELFFAENLVGSSLHQFFLRKSVNWGTTWRYVSIHEMEEFLAPFSRVQYRVLGFAAAFGRSERQRRLLAVLDRAVFNYAVPNSYKYIMVGIATK